MSFGGGARRAKRPPDRGRRPRYAHSKTGHGEIAVYAATTHDIRIEVEPSFLDDRSEPSENRYFWAYHIKVSNLGQETVQLLSRYWHITDGLGRVQEVRGPGVVGEQPVLEPGASFEYTSGCPLTTPSGIMRGHFKMQRRDGSLFEAEVPAFSLDLPGPRPRQHLH